MMHLSIRLRRRAILLGLTTVFICFLLPDRDRLSMPSPFFGEWTDAYDSFGYHIGTLHTQTPFEAREWDFSAWENPYVVPGHKTYKPPPEPVLPVPDPFPLLSQHPSPQRSLLRAPKANRPPRRHYPEQTPLFVGFTRNWPLLLQCVVSYIAAGWPPGDIYVVENTGVMYANREGKLTLQNPFYLNHTQLEMLGVSVIVVRP